MVSRICPGVEYSVLVICLLIFGSDWPLVEVDASKGKSGSEFKKELEVAALAIKNAYW